MRTGAGVLGTASADWGDFGVVTTASPWALAELRLARPPRAVVRVESLERGHLDALATRLGAVERVVGLGSGLALDAAKYVAWRLGRPLTQVPSTSSNNACFTRTSGCLVAGRRAPLREAPEPDEVIADVELIRLAPARLNRAGVGDLLSSHTALADWALARDAGREVDWDADLAMRTRRMLEGLAALAPAVGADDPAAFVELLALGETLAPDFQRFPRARFNSASEHLLAWCLEERTGRRLVHGEIVSLGILLMAHLQGNAPEQAAAVIRTARVAVQPAEIGITWDAVEAAVLALPAYAWEVVPWYTIVDELAPDARRSRARLRAAFDAARGFVEGLTPDTGAAPPISDPRRRP
jgi:glycerol-1-phosphate dehydrogenase [NAD(P)+]